MIGARHIDGWDSFHAVVADRQVLRRHEHGISRVKEEKIMKNKIFYRFALAIPLALLVLPACGSGNEVTVESPQIETGSNEGTVEATQIETESNNSTAEATQIEKGSLEFEGRQRDYMVFLPKNYTGTLNFPLVIYLHAYGWSAKMGMEYTLLHEVADTNDFMVVYPNAAANWNSGIGDNSSYPTQNVNDVGFINALIDTLSEHYSINLERIYATGYSNGGFMSYKLACQLSHRIAAIASVGGLISTSTEADCNPLRTVPVLQIHGTEDPWVSIEGAKGWHSADQTVSYWTNFNNCDMADTTILQDIDPTDGCTVEKISYTNCTNNSNVIYYKVIDGGHTWPGVGPPGYSAGNTNQDFNASVEIWNFFKDYKLTPTSIK
jgi:polyhydroxybutyrate depolymerase